MHRYYSAEDISRMSSGSRKTRDGFEARCPAHDDKRASLSISIGEDGKTLLRCHAGCSFDEIVRAYGLKPQHLFVDAGRESRRFATIPSNTHPTLGAIHETYDYVDKNGTLLFQVCRFVPKTFRPRQRDHTGEWTWRRDEVRRVPYRLPELIEAVAEERLIFVVEGEKDVHSLARLGLPATCNDGGAGKWGAAHAKYFAGASVVILPDNDDAGRKHAKLVRETLTGVARQILTVELPGLPEKGDVSDWLAAGHTVPELEDLIETAASPVSLTPGSVRVEDVPDLDELSRRQTELAIKRIREDTSTYPRFALRSLDELAGAMAPDELWFWLARQANGKSLVMQNIANWNIEQGIPTLYIGTEQDPDRLRIKQACVRTGVNPRLIFKPTPEERASEQYATARNDVERAVEWLDSDVVRKQLVFASTRYVNRSLLEKWVTGAVRKYGTRFIIVDHIDHMDHGDGRNAAQELKTTVQLAKDLACRHQVVIFCASQVKRAADPMQNFMPPGVDGGFGSAAKEHTADVVLGGWRPLRTDMSLKELRELRKRAAAGQVAESEVYQRNVMGVRLLKDRLGASPGKQTLLGVDRGRLVDLAERDRHSSSEFSAGRKAS